MPGLYRTGLPGALLMLFAASSATASTQERDWPQWIEPRLKDELRQAEQAVEDGASWGRGHGIEAIQASACPARGEDYWRYGDAEALDLVDDSAIRARLYAAIEAAIETLERGVEDQPPADVGPVGEEFALRFAYDQAASRGFFSAVAADDTASAMALMRAYCLILEDNTAYLADVIDAEGFPTLSEYGRAGQQQAVYLAIHTMDETLHRLIRAEADRLFSAGEMDPRLYGRIRDFTAMTLEGHQLVGHYHRCVDGVSVFRPPLRDREEAEALRAALGFNTLAEREARMARLMRCDER